MIIVHDPNSPSSIYKILSIFLGKLVLELQSSRDLEFSSFQELHATRAFFIPIRPNLSKEILVQITKEREACSHSQQDLQDMCCWSPSQRRIWRQNYGCILLCLSIIEDYHYGSTLIVFVMMIELYPFWLIYSCIYLILCLCLCHSLHVQVSINEDHGDRDRLEQRNGSVDSSTSTSVGIQVGPHHWYFICN